MIHWQEEKGPGHVEELVIQHVNDEVMIDTRYYYEPENEDFECGVAIPLDQFKKLLKQLEIEFGST